jgi:hypothetical protein
MTQGAACIASRCSLSQTGRSGQFNIKRQVPDVTGTPRTIGDHAIAATASRRSPTESDGVSDFSVIR